MNQEETIALLKGMQNKKVDYAEMVCAPAFAYGYEYVYPEPEDYAIEEAIKALKEVQQYREIGTVEEVKEQKENLNIAYQMIGAYELLGTLDKLRESMEKEKPKIPRFDHMLGDRIAKFKCPVCGNYFNYDCTDTIVFFCKKCGQALRMENEDD